MDLNSLLERNRRSLIKPNAAELAHVSDLPTETDDQVEAALERALSLCEADAILVTRAAKGMTLLTRGGSVVHARLM